MKSHIKILKYAVFITFFLTSYWMTSYVLRDDSPTACNQMLVVSSGVEFCVTVAETQETRVRGLSGTTELKANEGMLFVFDKVGDYGIWMKEMLFPLDIIWLDDEKKVVHIEESVPPESYPLTYRSKKPARYVLEINAGIASEKNITIGSQFTLK